MERNPELGQATLPEQQDGRTALQDESLDARTRTTPAAERDNFAFHQGPDTSAPAGEKPRDPYSYHQGDGPQLPQEMQEQLRQQLAEVRKQIDAQNFSGKIQDGEGPWQAIMRLRGSSDSVRAMSSDQIVAEARRIRDRDFAGFTDQNGRPRNWYKTGETVQRWTPEEVAKMMADAEANIVRVMQDSIKLQQEQAQVQRRQEEEAKLAEQQRQLDAAQQQELTKAVDAHVPNLATLEEANRVAETRIENLPEVRERIKAHVAQEVMAGSLKPEDLARPLPRIGSLFIGTQAITPAELTAALTEQAQLKQQAPENQQVPKLGELLRRRLQQPERLARFDQTSKFFDELKKILERQEAEAARPRAQ